MRFDCGGFSLELSEGWCDSTVDQSHPFTLTKSEGYGALQFNVALYHAGALPVVCLETLSEMLLSFASRNSLGESYDVVQEESELLIAAASFAMDDDNFLRVWYLSDRLCFSQITYVCLKENLGDELSECEDMVRSLRFS